MYIAGGEAFGGTHALQPLLDEFPNIATKETLARGGELTPYLNRSSILAAIDYIVSLSSDVFVPSHGGNMGRAMQVEAHTHTANLTDSFLSLGCVVD